MHFSDQLIIQRFPWNISCSNSAVQNKLDSNASHTAALNSDVRQNLERESLIISKARHYIQEWCQECSQGYINQSCSGWLIIAVQFNWKCPVSFSTMLKCTNMWYQILVKKNIGRPWNYLLPIYLLLFFTIQTEMYNVLLRILCRVIEQTIPLLNTILRRTI